jgi:hypothetical protein
MARQDHMNSDEKIDHRFLANFRGHLLWPIFAVIVFVIIGLAVLSPWAGDDNDIGPNALPTPVQAGTPSP